MAFGSEIFWTTLSKRRGGLELGGVAKSATDTFGHEPALVARCRSPAKLLGFPKWAARPDLGERRHSRLVATAAENRLSIRRNPHTSFFCGRQRLPNNRNLWVEYRPPRCRRATAAVADDAAARMSATNSSRAAVEE